jgi:transcriptional regulator with XRE-family HTH domain
MSQGELAGLVGCSRQFLNNLETGHSKELGAELAINIADVLNISIRWLVIGDPLRKYHRLAPDEEIGLLSYRALPPALKKHFLDSIKSLAAIHPTADDPFPLVPPLQKPHK